MIQIVKNGQIMNKYKSKTSLGAEYSRGRNKNAEYNPSTTIFIQIKLILQSYRITFVYCDANGCYVIIDQIPIYITIN